MGKHAQIVMGPAGSGKSTYCASMQQHCQARKRTVHVVNLDPAAESFSYPVSIDIRDLISLDDVMSELDYGPNGGLVYALDYLASHLDFLADQLNNYVDDYLLIDCPGQIELYTHLPTMRTIIQFLQREGYQVCAVYCLDSMFISDTSRFVAGVMMCLSAMIQLELPHINVLTKCDQITDKTLIDKYCDPQLTQVLMELNQTGMQGGEMAAVDESIVVEPYARLNTALSLLIDQYSMVAFHPLDLTDEESVDLCLMHIDHAIQYGEDVEPQEPEDEQELDSIEAAGLGMG